MCHFYLFSPEVCRPCCGVTVWQGIYSLTTFLRDWTRFLRNLLPPWPLSWYHQRELVNSTSSIMISMLPKLANKPCWRLEVELPKFSRALSCSDHHESHLTRIYPHGFLVRSLDDENCEFDCFHADVSPLQPNEKDLLIAVTSKPNRHRIYSTDKKALQFGLTSTKGDWVNVRWKIDGMPQEIAGILRYKGELPGQPGIQFGVELEVGITVEPRYNEVGYNKILL